MSIAQAERFYGPLREQLRERLRDQVAERAAAALARELDIEMPPALRTRLGDELSGPVANREFERFIEFMTGFRPGECGTTNGERARPAREECLALVYKGPGAVSRIREILGATDPAKAAPGSVRREYGMNIMVNAAHASDCVANAEREIEIIDIAEDTITPWVEKYYGTE